MEDDTNSMVSSPPVLALFQKRIEGDDALLRLAGLRFRQAGLIPEFHAETPEELEWTMEFSPSAHTKAVAHLPRRIDLFKEEDRSLILDFAGRFTGRLFGLVVHDQLDVADRLAEAVDVLGQMDSKLREAPDGPVLFVEYAAGLAPDLYISLFESIRGLTNVSSCVDTGHIGLWQARDVFAQMHPGRDVCSFKPDDPELPGVAGDVQRAVGSALEAVLRVIRALGRLGKPLHFHLHDGHPLWSSSPFGISDHLSFLTELPIPFPYRGKESLAPMFGPSGLFRIISEALVPLRQDQVSFSLEIHPTEGMLPLGDACYLFQHWKDKGNAERMNFWLSVLRENALLVSGMCGKSME
jgi:hypothetical protein